MDFFTRNLHNVQVGDEYFVEDAIRYGKIIIAADADADGFKIASLIAGFFAKKITDLIRLGYVYILDSPLYKQGDTYIYNDEVDKLDKNKPFTRFKGLGELSPDQAKEVLTGPNARLIQLTDENIDDALDLLSSTWSRKQLMTSSKIIIDKYNTGIL